MQVCVNMCRCLCRCMCVLVYVLIYIFTNVYVGEFAGICKCGYVCVNERQERCSIYTEAELNS